MTPRPIGTLIALFAAGLLAVPAVAEQPPSKKVRDPNQRVCEDIHMIGSRLAVKRICATRAEWAEARRQDRDAVDKAQMGLHGPCNTINSHTGAPSC
jgi:hypothetical protein